MGHRANFIILENKSPTIYYSHWAAQETPGILAQGLELCEQYFKKFDKVDFLMNSGYAEGGILIDKDNKNVLIFGGGDTPYTPALQRLYCNYINKKCENWDIKWCHSGNIGIATYLGLMEDRIFDNFDVSDFWVSDEWSRTTEKDRQQDSVITIITDGTITDYKQDWSLDGIEIGLTCGEQLKDLIPDDLKIETWQNEIETSSSLLVDYDHKKLFVCWANETDDRHIEAVRHIWKNWEVEFQPDGLIFHFEYTKRDKSIIEMTEEQFMEYCDDTKLLEYDPNRKIFSGWGSDK